MRIVRPPRRIAIVAGLAAILAGCSSTPPPSKKVADRPAPPPVAVAKPSSPAATTTGPLPPRPPSSVDPLDSLSFQDLIATLRARAESGEDKDLASHADLLAAIEKHGMNVEEKAAVRRAKEVEQAIGSKWKDGTAFCTVTCYVEPGAQAPLVCKAYSSYEHYQEWTGRPDVQLVSREGPDSIAAANGVRSGPFGLKFGAKWRFRSHPITRGRASINVVRMVPSADTEHMRETRSLLVAFPEEGGARVTEVSASDVDIDTPAVIGGIAISIAIKDVRERATNLRSRWQEVSR